MLHAPGPLQASAPPDERCVTSVRSPGVSVTAAGAKLSALESKATVRRSIELVCFVPEVDSDSEAGKSRARSDSPVRVSEPR